MKRLDVETMQLPLTVAVLTYNRMGGYLEETIDAILKQTFKNFELLVLDNASTDGTAQFILGLDDPRVRYIRNSPGSSVEFNYASAYHVARGQRIIVTHDDDIMEYDMLKTQMNLMDDNPDVVLSWTNVSTIDQEGKLVTSSLCQSKGDIIFKPGEYFLSFLKERLWPTPSTIMLDRRYDFTSLLNVHYFNNHIVRENVKGKNVEGTEDVLFPSRANIRGCVAYIAKPLLKYRLHPTQGTNGVDLSTPSIHLYKKLRFFIKKTPLSEQYKDIFDGYIIRFEVQKKITQISRSTVHPSTKIYFMNKYNKAMSMINKNTNVFYPIIPLHILINLIYPNSKEDFNVTSIAQPGAEQTLAIKFFYKWAIQQARNRSIFDGIEPESKIAILGSSFVASLLIIECNKVGIEVVCCLESNKSRHDGYLLGVPIVPIQWLRKKDLYFDTVILSSEKDQENYLKRLVTGMSDSRVCVLSWKDLVEKEDTYSLEGSIYA